MTFGGNSTNRSIDFKNKKGIFFVTCQKSNAAYRVVERHGVIKSKQFTSDKTIEFTGPITSRKCPVQLRCIGYRDPETGRHNVVLANNSKLAAKTIAGICEARWDIELFLKWIKQNLWIINPILV
ncbi:MAG: transposase [Candidatus Thiodiazotropha sp. 'RUGA']|nr:transposase [Candidatus Thiodiazotropha sp. 'RUGA']